MTHELVERLLDDCSFLTDHLDPQDFELPTIVFGRVAGLIAERSLAPDQEDRIFDHFNSLADSADQSVLDILGTGAIEMFNDNAGSQRLARLKLKGRARTMLEDFRRSWGQPDYGGVA